MLLLLQLYQEGVYHDYFCSQTKLDHGVLVAGYGDQYGKLYWWIKNRSVSTSACLVIHWSACYDYIILSFTFCMCVCVRVCLCMCIMRVCVYVAGEPTGEWTDS